MPAKLLVFARPATGHYPASGSLGQVPDVHVDRESLHHAILAPRRFLENRARQCGISESYVSKLLSYKMLSRLRGDPLAFFDILIDAGFLLDSPAPKFDQASLSTAQATHEYVLEKGTPAVDRAQ